jgi:DNA polymerase III subunit delta
VAARTDFDRHLEREATMPVYAFIGSESTLVAEAVSALRRKVLTAAADFNREELSAADTPIERALDAARTAPMMASHRFVHLSSVQALKAKDHGPLLAYLEQPAAHTVFCLSGEKIDQRTKLGLRLAAGGWLFVLEPPRQQELGGWIERRARKLGCRIDTDAARLLGDLVGTEVGNIDRAIEKLSLYAGPEASIASADVEATVAPTRLHSIFELTDAIGARDLGRASLLLRNTLRGGESALGVLGMITRQFRQLLQLKALERRGTASRDLATALGVRPFLVNTLTAQARRYRESELQAALEAAFAADIRLKSSGVGAGVVLDRLLVEVIEHGRA